VQQGRFRRSWVGGTRLAVPAPGDLAEKPGSRPVAPKGDVPRPVAPVVEGHQGRAAEATTTLPIHEPGIPLPSSFGVPSFQDGQVVSSRPPPAVVSEPFEHAETLILRQAESQLAGRRVVAVHQAKLLVQDEHDLRQGIGDPGGPDPGALGRTPPAFIGLALRPPLRRLSGEARAFLSGAFSRAAAHRGTGRLHLVFHRAVAKQGYLCLEICG